MSQCTRRGPKTKGRCGKYEYPDHEEHHCPETGERWTWSDYDSARRASRISNAFRDRPAEAVTPPCVYSPEIVIVESPFRGETAEDEARNKAYLSAIIRQLVLVEGLAPFASHQLYTSALDDGKQDERAAGIRAGFAFRRLASRTLVYTDLGISDGMKAGVEHAQEIGQAVEFRTLEGWGSCRKCSGTGRLEIFGSGGWMDCTCERQSEGE